MEYSIVIPAHNEEENIESFVTTFIHRLPCNVEKVLAEIIIVENGSTDDTLDACRRLQEKFPKLIRTFSNDRGSYGKAVKRGILESRGTHLSILECDFLDADFVASSIDLFQANKARFIVASKRHPDSVDQRPLKRRILTKLFNCILNIFLGYPGTDTHGLKSIETKHAKQLCELAITTDEIFQTEIVLLAWRLGVKIEELPIYVCEVRPPPISMRKRFPIVVDAVRSLRRSLQRFPERSIQL
jgi:glycosyltransferase involved in cell wall biosynthesis